MIFLFPTCPECGSASFVGVSVVFVRVGVPVLPLCTFRAELDPCCLLSWVLLALSAMKVRLLLTKPVAVSAIDLDALSANGDSSVSVSLSSNALCSIATDACSFCAGGSA